MILIYGAADYPSANTLCVPTEHVFVGLLSVKNTALVVTWPMERVPLRLR